jgi:DNA-binding LytR/AlgR family response regulator
MTAAEAAKKVRRTVTFAEGKATKTKLVPVAANEVLSFKDYGTHVVVVTKDGQKFSSQAEEAEEA